MMFNALLDRIHGHYAATQEDEIALAALDAALAEPEQKPEPITEDALREWLDARDRDLWQRRADEAFLKEYEKRHGKPEPATDEQIVKAGGECAVVDNEYLLDFRDGFRAAERFHGITKGDKT
jgi:hypothetical protein